MIHPKKGSPSGRNAYPVTEKMEELKKEEKNDMAKKKTFQEYTQEALYEIEKTEAALKQAKLEKEQAEHRIQRSLNYLDTQKKKKRKARTHLLIQKGAAIEAICKDTKYLTEAEFYQLMDELLHNPACKFCDVVHEMVLFGKLNAASSVRLKQVFQSVIQWYEAHSFGHFRQAILIE